VQEHGGIALLLDGHIISVLQGPVYNTGREKQLKLALVQGHFQNVIEKNARSLNPGVQSTGQGLKAL